MASCRLWRPISRRSKPAVRVHAETLEAIRLGAISKGEGNALPTAMQLDSIRMAGERAVTNKMASL